MPATKTRRSSVKTRRTAKKAALPVARKPAPRRPKQRVLAMVGTRKGAFIFESGSDRAKWKMSGPHFAGWAVQHINAPEQCETLLERCREIFGSEPVLVSEIGPVLSANTGPGLLGVGSIPRHFLD